MNDIKPCLVCGSDNTRCEQYIAEGYTYYTTYAYRIVCDDCFTMFGNLYQEDIKKETIEWFNGLPRKE